jgi:PAS domain S-box-containing protein
VVEWDCVPIVSEDQYHGSLSMYRDITERKQVERSLRDSEARFRAMFEQAAMGIAQLDLQGRFVQFNQRLCHILGYDAATLRNQHLYNIEVQPDPAARQDMRSTPTQLNQFLCGAIETYAHEQQYRRADGTLVWGHMTLSLVRQGGGEPDYFIAILDDVSDRKQAEAEILRALDTEKDLNELKTRFIDMASHEFRTPLTTILGSVELLRLYGKQWDETKRSKYLQRLQDAGLRMKALVDNVLTISRANTEHLTLSPHLFDVIQFCHNLIEELSMGQCRQTIRLHTEGNLCDQSCYIVYLEDRLLHHILSNLLSNAMKYSPPDSLIQVSLAVEHQMLIFRVEDQGIGIPLADQDRLFDAFHRARNVGKVAGTGLGLNIVKKYVELQGGTIVFCSQEGFGTTFRVALPLIREVVN